MLPRDKRLTPTPSRETQYLARRSVWSMRLTLRAGLPRKARRLKQRPRRRGRERTDSVPRRVRRLAQGPRWRDREPH
jgi:hypothetical protein